MQSVRPNSTRMLLIYLFRIKKKEKDGEPDASTLFTSDI